LLGPELALSPQFDDEVLKDPNFREKLCLVAIDELHIVDQWGNDFRKAYSQLAILRKCLPRDVPWFGTSATLDPDMLEQVKELAGFNSDVTVMRTSIDRPEIGFEIRPMKYTAASFGDLEFLVEPAKECPPNAANVLKDGFVDALDRTPSNQHRITVATEAIRKGDFEAARGFLQGENMASQALKYTAEINKRKKELEAKQQLAEMDNQMKSWWRCNRIPKTIVYVERIAEIEVVEL
jgi:superfamily II DNA helicase RecQ